MDLTACIERLELIGKIIAWAGIAFWLLCLCSLENKIIGGVGMFLPCMALFSNKLSFQWVYIACTVIYVIIAIVITRHFFQFIPHLACCFCLVGNFLLSEIIDFLERHEINYNLQSIKYKDLSEVCVTQSQKIKDYKNSLDKLYFMTEEECEEKDNKSIESYYTKIKDQVDYMWFNL